MSSCDSMPERSGSTKELDLFLDILSSIGSAKDSELSTLLILLTAGGAARNLSSAISEDRANQKSLAQIPQIFCYYYSDNLATIAFRHCTNSSYSDVSLKGRVDTQ